MEYMETSGQPLEASRLTRLLAGLNTFVQGEPGSDDWSTPASPNVDVRTDSQSGDYTPGVPGDLGVEHTDQDLSSWRRCFSSETILFQRYYRLFWARLNTIMS